MGTFIRSLGELGERDGDQLDLAYPAGEMSPLDARQAIARREARPLRLLGDRSDRWDRRRLRLRSRNRRGPVARGAAGEREQRDGNQQHEQTGNASHDGNHLSCFLRRG
jgi:hypothetical protein